MTLTTAYLANCRGCNREQVLKEIDVKRWQGNNGLTLTCRKCGDGLSQIREITITVKNVERTPLH